MKIVILGLSATSSWGNGHATTYRSLIKGLVARGHDVLFLERDLPWYAENRDLKSITGARIEVYSKLASLKRRFRQEISRGDAVIVGSFVPEGKALGEWILRVASGVVAFYDIDTPVTLEKLAAGTCDYLDTEMIRQYPLYLSFSGGPVLRQLELEFGSPCARALYCSVDPERHHPIQTDVRWDLGYLGTYAGDRQPAIEHLMLTPARRLQRARFVVAGAQYPRNIDWPENVERLEHVSPFEHGRFYAQQRFTLNVTRVAMIRAGYSPSVRLFEAAACGTPIITDGWPGLETVFQPGREVLVARDGSDVSTILESMTPAAAGKIGAAARACVLAQHTGIARARELEKHLQDAADCSIAASQRSSRRSAACIKPIA